jgi:uncharacterized membrane protein
VNYIPVTQSRKDRRSKNLAVSRKLYFQGLKSLFVLLAWAFLVYLFQPFITAVVWWQGYQRLLLGKATAVAAVVKVFTMIEYVVCLSILFFWTMLSWQEWKKWHSLYLVENDVVKNK